MSTSEEKATFSTTTYSRNNPNIKSSELPLLVISPFQNAQHYHLLCTDYATKILRAHGMIDNVLQQVFRSVVLFKLRYAFCVCRWGFTKASDKQRIDNFIGRSHSVNEIRLLSCRPTIFRISLRGGSGKTV